MPGYAKLVTVGVAALILSYVFADQVAFDGHLSGWFIMMSLGSGIGGLFSLIMGTCMWVDNVRP